MDAIMCNYWLVSARALASNTSKNTPTHKKHVCTHDYRLSNANSPGCAAVTIGPGQRHKETRTVSLLPLSSFRSRRTACGREIASWTWIDTQYCEIWRWIGWEDDQNMGGSRLLCVGETPEINGLLLHVGFTSTAQDQGFGPRLQHTFDANFPPQITCPKVAQSAYHQLSKGLNNSQHLIIVLSC